MTEDFRLSADRREKLGSKAAARLRNSGRVPANLYGWKKDVLALSVAADDVEKLVAGGSRVVDVELNGNVEKAVVQELQWDTFSTHVQHLDLKRVDPDGMATVDVPVEIRGEPAALKEGAELRQLQKTVRVTCSDYRVPKTVAARTAAMSVGDKLTAGELRIPDAVRLDTPADTVVVELYNPRKAAAESSEATSASAPE